MNNAILAAAITALVAMGPVEREQVRPRYNYEDPPPPEPPKKDKRKSNRAKQRAARRATRKATP